MKSILELIETAVSSGATGYTFSTHPLNMQILNAMRDSVTIRGGLGLYPVLPYAQGYVRLANEKGMRGLVEEIFSRVPLTVRARSIVEGGLSAIKSDFLGIFKTYLDIELAGYMNVKPANAALHSVLLHEVATDLCLGLRQVHLLEAFMEHVRQEYHAKPGFVTYNLPRFIELFRKNAIGLSDVVIMTPFNNIGYQMSPSRASCEAVLSDLRGPEVIAMSVLAGGYLQMDDAIRYISNLPNLSGVAVGISSQEHARNTFRKLQALTQIRHM